MWGLLNTFVGIHSGVSFTLGVHPHKLFLNNVESMFARLSLKMARYPEADAVGEIGLDFTTKCFCLEAHNVEQYVQGKIKAKHQFLRKAAVCGSIG